MFLINYQLKSYILGRCNINITNLSQFRSLKTLIMDGDGVDEINKLKKTQSLQNINIQYLYNRNI